MLLACVVAAALMGTAPGEVGAVRWERREAGDFVILHAPGYEEDAELFASWAAETRQLVDRFLQMDSVPRVSVYLHPREDWSRSEHEAYSQPQNRAVHFLSPSDSPHHPVWFRKNLIHEYGHIVVKSRMGRKFWGYRQLPDWFEEGLVEYIAVVASDAEIRSQYTHYFDEVRAAVYRGDTSFLFRGNVYAWGLFTVAFFLNRYGHEALLELLDSRARTFPQALEQVTGLTASEFSAEWERWLPGYIATVDWVKGDAPGSGPTRGAFEPTSNLGRTESATGRFFIIREPLFIVSAGGRYPAADLVITSPNPLPRTMLEGTVRGEGLEPQIMADPDEIRRQNPAWLEQGHLTAVRVVVPLVPAGSVWISRMPVTLQLQPEQTVWALDVYGRWHQVALEWL